MTEGNKDKACVLSDQFSRVFIEEPEGDTPTAAPRNGRDIDSINITKEKINKIFRKIGNAEDHTKLQEDLDELRRWTEKWLLSFHPDKSRYMRLGRTTVEDQEYSLQNPIQRSDQEKDIGVVIDDTLTFSDHLAEKINKANRIVGLMRRTFTNLEPETFKPLFTALVRPHLEYANQIGGFPAKFAGSGTPYHPLSYGTIRSVHRTFKTIQAQLCHGHLLRCFAVLGACQLEE
ncbi:hypothetical protein Pmani_016590 [Petrolisthes manimaculis]|uniref:Uncharacterized protein n=1 Tax=Petrolisthes manimaculis TaxID=1843537 RepID=A0AAE1UAV3_9EUCA|nr:hypothetical protein Pmani_016590 [Petrolisthes manimaculis]